MKRFARGVIHTIEYILACLFVWGGLNTITYDEVVTTPEVYLKPLVGPSAIFLYGVLFLWLGASLIAGKLLRNPLMHGYALLGMYLTCVYVVILELLLEGWSHEVLSNVAFVLITAALYLRWRYTCHVIKLKE